MDKDTAYKKFAETNPSLESYETKLAYFEGIEKEIEKVGSIHVIGALSLNTKHLKKHLRDDCNGWTVRVRKTIMFVSNACSFLQLTILFLLYSIVKICTPMPSVSLRQFPNTLELQWASCRERWKILTLLAS